MGNWIVSFMLRRLPDMYSNSQDIKVEEECSKYTFRSVCVLGVASVERYRISNHDLQLSSFRALSSTCPRFSVRCCTRISLCGFEENKNCTRNNTIRLYHCFDTHLYICKRRVRVVSVCLELEWYVTSTLWMSGLERVDN